MKPMERLEPFSNNGGFIPSLGGSDAASRIASLISFDFWPLNSLGLVALPGRIDLRRRSGLW
jgi:hypothetical protein